MSASVVVTDYKSEHVLSSLWLGWPLPWRSAHLRLAGPWSHFFRWVNVSWGFLLWMSGLVGGRAHLGHRAAGQKVGGDAEVGVGGWTFWAGAALEPSPRFRFHLRPRLCHEAVPSTEVWGVCSPHVVRWGRQGHPTPVLLPGKSHGWRGSLVGCSHGVAKSRTWLSDFTFTYPFHALEKELATHSSVLA